VCSLSVRISLEATAKNIGEKAQHSDKIKSGGRYFNFVEFILSRGLDELYDQRDPIPQGYWL
jgi:hypothetical protein